MIRKQGVMSVLALALMSAGIGCCCRERPLLARFRAQGAMPYAQLQQPYGEQLGAGACGCGGTGMEGMMMPGAAMPGGAPILINPPPGVSEGAPLPPLNGMPPAAPSPTPDQAKPMPAGPSKETKNSRSVQPASIPTTW
jgi:hypothetical protein